MAVDIFHSRLARYTKLPGARCLTHVGRAGPADLLRILAIAITSLLAFAAWIGLVSFWRHARGLYLLSWAIWILFILFAGTRVRTSVGSVFGALDALVAGVIVGLVYFSDLARRFEPAPVQVVAPAGTSLSANRA